MSQDLKVIECATLGIYVHYECTKLLFSGKSSFQKIEIFQTKDLGRILVHDDVVMLSERDEFVYHDMISHVPLFVHPHPQHVLIIGGGDGGTAREVLRHQQVETCDMVEIDEMVIKACKEFIPQTSQSFSNPKLNLIIEDGINYVKKINKKYDVIIVDSSDPTGPAVPLFGHDFYQYCFNALSERGIIISQAESSHLYLDKQKQLAEITKSLFEQVHFYRYENITYPGGLWNFMFCSKKLDPINDFDESRVSASQIDFQYYNVDIHKASFAQPAFVKEELKLK